MIEDGPTITRRRVLASVGLLVAGGGAWTFRPAPVTDRAGWREAARLPTARGEMKGAVHDGRLYVPGGLEGLGESLARMDAYDPSADAWESVAPMPEALNHHATAVLDGTLFVVGGNRRIDDPPEPHVFAYDPSADAWEVRDPLPEGRWGHELVAHDGRLHLVGGESTGSDAALIFDGDRWSRGASMPTPREHLTAGVLDDRILAVGGRRGGENDPTVEAYDPGTDDWTRIDAEPAAWSGAAGAVVDGTFHLAGGENPATVGGATTDRHETYDGGTGGDADWQAAQPLPLALHGPTAVALDGAFYVVGGAWRQGLLSATAWSDRVFVHEP